MSRDASPGFALPGLDPDLAGEDDLEPGPGPEPDVVSGLKPEPDPGTSASEPGTGSGGSENQARNRRRGSGTGPQNQAGPAAGTPERDSVVRSAWLAVLAWARRSAHNHKRHRSFGHWIWTAWFNTQPDALIPFAKYVWSNAWVKEYMTGWVRAVAEWEYRMYLLLIGGPLVELGNSLSRIGARQSRFWLVLAAALLAYLIYALRH